MKKLWQLCACAAGVCKLVCNFAPYHTFLTFTCATFLNCTYIKWSFA